MIRFTCPGCETPFTVADEKAGKSGKCPKCQTQFVIPNAPAPEPTASLPPSIPKPSHTVEIAPCPSCGSRLSVEAKDLGLDIECPNCQTQYKALPPGEPANPPVQKEPTPSKRRREVEDEDEEDERPVKRSNRRRDEDEDYEDDDYRRRPSLKTKPGELQAVAIMLLIGGILACISGLALVASCYGLLWPGSYYAIVFGIMAIVRAAPLLGNTDRKPPPKGLCIMQIICVVNCDLANCVMGIVGLVLLGNEEVVRYYARRGRR